MHSEADTGPFGPCWSKKEHTASVHLPPMTRTEVSLNPRIPASTGNPASYVQADDNGNMSSILTG